jgi:4-amino-4-deoxy-L-arabinose transferase-like glycosyltransferase
LEQRVTSPGSSPLKTVLPFVLFASLLLVIAITSMRTISMTWDELAHLPAGCTYIRFHDYHLNPEHPPFIKLLAGLGALTAHPRLDTYNWRNVDQWRYGEIFYDDNGADRMLFRGRLPIVLLSVLLGLAVYCCAWELYGWKAGCLALLLYLLNPDLLAHGQLVTTDLGLSCFLFISVYTFWRALLRLTIGRGLLTCVAIGLTLSTKFSGVLIIPMLVITGLIFAFSKYPVKLELLRKRVVLGKPVIKLSAVGGLLIAAGVVSLVIIWGCYGFRYAISPDPLISSDLRWGYYLEKPGVVVKAARLAKTIHLVPEAYTYGFVSVVDSAERRYSFLLGNYSWAGWWYYFIITFLIKTPLALIGLIVLGGFFMRRYGAGWAMESTLLLPPAFYFAVAMANSLNIGHRHVLPIYPFLIVFASKITRAFEVPRRKALSIVVALLLVWHVAATAYIYPHFLSYFNEITGGPGNGWKWVGDSNIDWGQDLKALGDYHRRNPETPLYIFILGNGNPKSYGLDDVRLLPGAPLRKPLDTYTKFADVPSGAVVAVSVSFLQGMVLRGRVPGFEEFVHRLRSLQPFDRVGYSIYRMP